MCRTLSINSKYFASQGPLLLVSAPPVEAAATMGMPDWRPPQVHTRPDGGKRKCRNEEPWDQRPQRIPNSTVAEHKPLRCPSLRTLFSSPIQSSLLASPLLHHSTLETRRKSDVPLAILAWNGTAPQPNNCPFRLK
ncbi:hypothetical protein BKA56DRAFT_108600 [Ilyonectria sp. MPI-CAGE-AT-0026]|nr:hypothetical protein BKA56DRAFT_108600 [Ilyonectria sp. MPI-CAGE-AT-0026]